MQNPQVFWAFPPGAYMNENPVACVKNVIIFIIRVLKLLLMQGKYIFLVLFLFFAVAAPAAASTNKIAEKAPVFIGETNVDISSALGGCRVIAWWPPGSEVAGTPAKNITIRQISEISAKTFHYNFSPDVFSDYTGKWYCEDTQPIREIFTVIQPRATIRVWDMDTDTDVTGKTVPGTANITYRIETNLFPAQQYLLRPELTPADTFFTIKLTDPSGKGITNIYTGSVGGKDTQILLFDSTPLITSSPYYWAKGTSWNRAARGANGEFIYAPGTYTFSMSQNLNGMNDGYRLSGINQTDGILTSAAAITFSEIKVLTTPEPTATPVVTISVAGTTPSAAATNPVMTAPSVPATTAPVPVKTTYSPVPAWIPLAGLGIALVVIMYKRN